MMNNEMNRMNVILTRALEYDGSQDCLASQIRDLTSEEEDKYIEALLYARLHMNKHDGKKPDIETLRSLVFALTEEEKEYLASCKKFDSEMTYEEYIINIYNCLQISDWRFKPDSSLKIIRNETETIKKCFAEQKPVESAMIVAGSKYTADIN